MKSKELFIALGLATAVGLSSNSMVNASEHELINEESDKTSTYLVSEGGEGGEGEETVETIEGGEGGEGEETVETIEGGEGGEGVESTEGGEGN